MEDRKRVCLTILSDFASLVLLEMLLQVAFLGKCLVSHPAFIRLDSFMHSSVIYKVPGFVELLASVIVTSL